MSTNTLNFTQAQLLENIDVYSSHSFELAGQPIDLSYVNDALDAAKNDARLTHTREFSGFIFTQQYRKVGAGQWANAM